MKYLSLLSRMPAVLCSLIFLCHSAGLQAQDARRPPTPADIDAIVAEGFPAARDRIAKLLVSSYQPGQMGMSGSSGNPAFTSWLTLWRWCELLSRTEESEAATLIQHHIFKNKATGNNTLLAPGQNASENLTEIPRETALQFVAQQSSGDNVFSRLLPEGSAPATGLLATRLKPAFAAELLRDEKFLRIFFTTLSPRDYAPLVLAHLQSINDSSPSKWKSYSNLAIALAVVNDTKKPSYWPHPQVKQALVPREEIPVAKQFEQWVAANENHGTLADLRTLSPSQLKFVVDAPVAPSELEWARKNIRLPRVNFSRAFFVVKYRHDRLKSQQYTWSEAPYLLQNIQKLGGICVDQAYFAMLAGKACGLPTLFFTGQGTGGGHAWFGFLKADERWELDCGRYATQNYATGEALDPQTWTPISDHELQMLTAKFREQPAFLASTADLTLGALLEHSGDQARATKAFESAVRTCPAHNEAWEAQSAFLARSGAPAPARKAFHEAALLQFANNRDIKAAHLQALADISRETGDTTTANKLEHQILAENRTQRSDLSVGIASRQMDTLLEAGKFDEATKEFKKQLVSLGQTGGGTFFYDVVSPYVRAMIKANKKPEAIQAIRSARTKLAPDENSPLESGLKALEASAK